MRETKNVNGFLVVSQDITVPSREVKQYAERYYLPLLLLAWNYIERVTGYKWRSTSYWRLSPTHQHGEAIDLVPDIARSSMKYYAVFRNSDPVLYKREKLMRQLQHVCGIFPPQPFQIGIFVEPDHLHVQVLSKSKRFNSPMILVKWKQPKSTYGDTTTRMKGGMISTRMAKRLVSRFK